MTLPSAPPPSGPAADAPRSQLAVIWAVTKRIARFVAELALVALPYEKPEDGRSLRAALDSLDETPEEMRARSRAAVEIWEACTGPFARRIYRLAAFPVLLVVVAGWLTAEHGLAMGAAFGGAIALAVFVYLLATPTPSSAAPTSETAPQAAVPTPGRVALCPPGPVDQHGRPVVGAVLDSAASSGASRAVTEDPVP